MQKFTITSPADGLKLACVVCEPDKNVFPHPKGLAQLLHGMCDHKERFYPFIEFLTANGYVCIIHDQRGHGESINKEQDFGYLGKNGWKALIADTKAINDWAKTHYPGLKTVLFGHSMGSMVARSFAKRYDSCIDALFVCGCPADNPVKGVGKMLAAIFGIFRGWHFRPQLLQKLSFGEFNKSFDSEGTPNAWVCSDAETMKKYNSDPLCQFIFTANGFYNLTSLMEDCYSKHGWAMQNPSMPVHFISGALDPCRSDDKALKNAVHLMIQVGYKNSDLKLYPDMRHEILNEAERKIVFNDILACLSQVCQ